MLYQNNVKALVTKGPSKMDLVTALAYAFDKVRGPFDVTFYLLDNKTKHPLDAKADHRYPISDQDGTPVAAKITGLSYENGSGESILISGALDYYKGDPHERSFDIPFSGCYSTKSQTGYLEFTIHTADDKSSDEF